MVAQSASLLANEKSTVNIKGNERVREGKVSTALPLNYKSNYNVAGRTPIQDSDRGHRQIRRADKGLPRL